MIAESAASRCREAAPSLATEYLCIDVTDAVDMQLPHEAAVDIKLTLALVGPAIAYRRHHRCVGVIKTHSRATWQRFVRRYSPAIGVAAYERRLRLRYVTGAEYRRCKKCRS